MTAKNTFHFPEKTSHDERNYTKEVLLMAFLDKKPGEIIKYNELKQLTNMDITGDQNWILQWVLRAALNKHNIYFENVRGVGYQRSVARDLAKSGKRAVSHIQRTSKKAGRIMDTADRKDLSTDQALEHDAQRGVIAAIQAASRNRKSAPQSAANGDPEVTL